MGLNHGAIAKPFSASRRASSMSPSADRLTPKHEVREEKRLVELENLAQLLVPLGKLRRRSQTRGTFRPSHEVQRVFLEANACRLEIAMEDALLMSDMEGIGDLQGQPRGVLRRQRPPQRRPLQELQHEIPRPDVVDLTDVRVVQRRDGARLLLEASDAVGVGITPRRQYLDGDVAAEARVVRAVDLAHSAPAEERHDVVRAEARPGRQGHRRGVWATVAGITLPNFDGAE